MRVIIQIIAVIIGATYFINILFSHNYFSGKHWNYKKEYIKTITMDDGTELKLERAHIYPDDRTILPFNRYQFRNEDGNVVAFTPTRGQAIPFCPSYDGCYIFMWKTVYPLPGIFKFNPDKRSWILHKDPSMKYSTSGNDGYGFTDVTSPLFGSLGLVLFLFYKLWYFVLLIFLSLLLVAQMIKFHDLPEEVKKEWMKFFMMINAIIHMAPIDPYSLTGMVLVLYQFIGVLYFGIPITHTFIISIVAFLCGAVYAGRLKTGYYEPKRI